ncbi:hypothetical protein C8R43DRAFT_1120231 [Mycena crocata]|nr:hypothetical protein C8R43DRAFT_1120231 [Mycena crocata]
MADVLLAHRAVIGALAVLFPFYIHALPAEVWVIIFRHTRSDLRPGSRAFAQMRCRVSLVSRLWKTIAYSDHLVWRCLVMDRYTSPSAITAFSIHSDNRLVSVAFLHMDLSRGGEAKLLAAADLACTFSHRWVAMDIKSSYAPAIDALLRRFALLPGPCLQRVSIACTAFFSPSPFHSMYLRPLTIFGGVFNQLCDLDLSACPLAWNSLTHLPNLLHFSLRDIPRTSWPSARHVLAILSAAPALEIVTLRNVGLSSIDLAPCPVLALSTVRYLDVMFARNNIQQGSSLRAFLALISFGSLHDMRVTFPCSASIRSFCASGLTFSSPNLHLTGQFVSAGDVPRLLECFSNVVSLDLRGATAAFIQGLGERRHRRSGAVLPLLCTLYIHPDHWQEVAFCIRERILLGAPKLKVLACQLRFISSGRVVVGVHAALYDFVRANVESFQWLPFARPISRRPRIITQQ